MDNEITEIVDDLNKEFGTDFNRGDVTPLLKITLKHMMNGKSFEESFESSFKSLINTHNRLAKGTKHSKMAGEVIFKELYNKN
jgi:hypothetical protein